MARRRPQYSAEVVLRLAIGGQTLALSQVGPGFVVLQQLPTDSAEPATGRIDVIVNNRVASSESFFFPHGLCQESKHVDFW